MCLCSKQSSLFSFYALPSGGKSKDVVVHCNVLALFTFYGKSKDIFVSIFVFICFCDSKLLLGSIKKR